MECFRKAIKKRCLFGISHVPCPAAPPVTLSQAPAMLVSPTDQGHAHSQVCAQACTESQIHSELLQGSEHLWLPERALQIKLNFWVSDKFILTLFLPSPVFLGPEQPSRNAHLITDTKGWRGGTFFSELLYILWIMNQENVLFIKTRKTWEFPDSFRVRVQCFHCYGPGFSPCLGN